MKQNHYVLNNLLWNKHLNWHMKCRRFLMTGITKMLWLMQSYNVLEMREHVCAPCLICSS